MTHLVVNWGLRHRVRLWHRLADMTERRLRRAYDQLAAHDSQKGQGGSERL